jgi:hypothetical protein
MQFATSVVCQDLLPDPFLADARELFSSLFPQLFSYEKATVTRQKEYACEQLTWGKIRRVAMP